MKNNRYYSNDVVKYDSDYSDDEDNYNVEELEEVDEYEEIKKMTEHAKQTKEKIIRLFNKKEIKKNDVMGLDSLYLKLVKNGIGNFREQMKMNELEKNRIIEEIVKIDKDIRENIDKAKEITLTDARIFLVLQKGLKVRGDLLKTKIKIIEIFKKEFLELLQNITIFIMSNEDYKKEFLELASLKIKLSKYIISINNFIKNFPKYEGDIDKLTDFLSDLEKLIENEDLYNIYKKLQKRRGDVVRNQRFDLMENDFSKIRDLTSDSTENYTKYKKMLESYENKIIEIKKKNIYEKELVELEKNIMISKNHDKFYYDLRDVNIKDPKYNTGDKDNRKKFMEENNNDLVKIINMINEKLGAKTDEEQNIINNQKIVDEINNQDKLKKDDITKKLDINSGLDNKTKKEIVLEEANKIELEEIEYNRKKKYSELPKEELKEVKNELVSEFMIHLSKTISVSKYKMTFLAMIDLYDDFITNLQSYDILIDKKSDDTIMEIIGDAVRKQIEKWEQDNINLKTSINYYSNILNPSPLILKNIENIKNNIYENNINIETSFKQIKNIQSKEVKYMNHLFENEEVENITDIMKNEEEGINFGKGLKKKKTISKSEILKIIKQSKQKIKSKKGGNFLDAFSQIEHQQEPKNVREYLQAYGNLEIDNIVLHRTPIDGKINTLLNIITLGQFEQNKKDLNIDSMFHLYMTVQLKGKSGYTRIEKNQTVTMTDIENPRSTDEYELPFHPRINLKVLFQNGLASLAEKVGSGNEYNYNGQNNNCQIFLMSLLDGNAIDNNESVKFILQDTKYVVGNINSVSKSIMKGAIDLAQFTNILIYGAGLYR